MKKTYRIRNTGNNVANYNEVVRTCRKCHGTGRVDCEVCGCSGSVACSKCMGFIDCSECNGKGYFTRRY